MIGFKVIDLLFEKQGPEVFAEKLYDVEGSRWARGIAGESLSRR